MSNELQVEYAVGETVYAVLLNAAGSIWDGSAFVAIVAASWSSYAITLTAAAGTGIYEGSIPSAVPTGTYNAIAYRQLGISPDPGDPAIAEGRIGWPGGALPSGVQGPTTLSAMLGAIRNLIVGAGLYAQNNAFVSTDPAIFPATGSPFCAVRPGRYRLIWPQNTGAGTYVPGVEGEFIARVVERSRTDHANRDDAFLLTQDTGLLDRAYAVAAVLHGAWPLSACGDLLTQEEIRFASQSDPFRHPKDNAWGAVDLTFKANWTMKLL